MDWIHEKESHLGLKTYNYYFGTAICIFTPENILPNYFHGYQIIYCNAPLSILKFELNVLVAFHPAELGRWACHIKRLKES